MKNEHAIKRAIKSFACRRGQSLSSKQEAVWQRLWPLYGLENSFSHGNHQKSLASVVSPLHGAPEFELDLAAIFEREADKILEIGFGNGSSLLEMAANSKEKDYIAVEVYRKGISELLLGIEKLGLSNIRIIWGDAVEVLERVKDGSLSGIQVFFADPWPKLRHHKRRLIQSLFVQKAALKLKAEGCFHLATDWEDYAHHMMSVISNNRLFRNMAGENQYSSRPTYRPVTKYEQRGLRLGHKSWDLIFKRL